MSDILHLFSIIPVQSALLFPMGSRWCLKTISITSVFFIIGKMLNKYTSILKVKFESNLSISINLRLRVIPRTIEIMFKFVFVQQVPVQDVLV